LGDERGRWCGMSQATDDRFDWKMSNRLTPSEETGPENAFNGNWYIYIEASHPRQLNDTAK